MSLDCLLGIVTKPTDSRLSETMALAVALKFFFVRQVVEVQYISLRK